MKTPTLIIIISSLLLLTGFRFQEKSNENPYVIPLAKNISRLSEIKCSQFIDSFEYIPLETKDNCLIDEGYKALILKDRILIYQVSYCYVFDRKTGKFLYELGKHGRGPEEYSNSLMAYDYENSVVYSSGNNNNMIMYTLSGKYAGSFPMPEQRGGMDDPSFMVQLNTLPDSCIVGHYINILGIENKLLTVFNCKGEIVKTFPNRNVYPKHPLKTLDLMESMFYRYNNNTFYKERSNDTVLRVTENSLIPHLIFETEKYTVPYEYQWWLPEEREKADLIIISKIFENDSRICIMADKKSEDYFALFDKKSRKLSVSKIDEGIPNDIDDFIPFLPEYSDEEGNLVQVVNATEISKWFRENPSGFSGNIKELQEVDIYQNPVVIIGRSKTD